MDEVEEYLGEDFFEEEGPGVSNQNEPPSDAELINKAFKKDEPVKAQRKLRPQPKFRELELCGPKGIASLENVFKDQKFDTRQNPYQNLAIMMNKIEYWAHLFHPSVNFDDFISRVETLGEKRMVQAHMNGLRLGIDARNAGSDERDNRSIDGSEDERMDEPVQMNEADDMDEIINQYYENPDSVIISSAQHQQSAATQNTQDQEKLVEESKQPDLDEIRKKRTAFFERTGIGGVTENLEESSPSLNLSEPFEDAAILQHGLDSEQELMDDLSALDLVYSAD